VLVSVITPSLQQGRFIERTLESVWRQRHPSFEIEHIVMDGGSTDGTLDILQRWSGRITYFSRPDHGQAAAINAGLAIARGGILAYLNSDDVYLDHAVEAAVAAFDASPDADVIYGDAHCIDSEDRMIGSYPTSDWSLERLHTVCYLCQPAVFFRRSVLDEFGPLDDRLHYCMDYEYWLRLGMGGARFAHIRTPLASSRIHRMAKTIRTTMAAHVETNDMLLARLGKVPDNWLWNYAHAVLDGRGVPRGASRTYLGRIALHTLAAAFRWNGMPSLALLRTLGSWYVRGASTIPPRPEPAD
jgi:glycosyltransferase involved in cell wall biosynthesis